MPLERRVRCLRYKVNFLTDMLTFYKRKCPSRSFWTEEDLNSAVNEINGGAKISQVSRNYKISIRTLKRRMQKNDFSKGRMRPAGVLGEDAERKLCSHIKMLQRRVFTLTRTDVRVMAFRLAEKIKIKHTFNKTEEKAGLPWLHSLLRRNPDLAVRKAEGLSRHRMLGMNIEVVGSYFQLLGEIMEEHALFDKPASIYNVDETGLQLNVKPGMVIAEKDSKAVSVATPQERGETITVITCCNAEGNFLPPACIFKGTNRKTEFLDDMPPGSQLYMNKKSAYINSDIFLEWLTTHFFPKKTAGKCLLILDGHASHTNCFDVLDFAEKHDILLFCLPPHTTHYLQPLDRAVFKSLKSGYNQACYSFLKAKNDRRITRLNFGKLLNEAWGKAASVQNAVSGFRATGIYPYHPGIIPDYAFTEEPNADLPQENQQEHGNEGVVLQEQVNSINIVSETVTSNARSSETATQGASCSFNNPGDLSQDNPETKDNDETPGKLLNQIVPLPQKIEAAKGRAKRVAELLTSPENLQKRKTQKVEKEKKQKVHPKPGPSSGAKNTRSKQKAPTRKRGNVASSSDEDGFSVHDSHSDMDKEELDEYACKGCGEDYYGTKKVEDWIQCIHCDAWLHEGCTTFTNICQPCGKMLLKTK